MPLCTWCLRGRARLRVIDHGGQMHYFHPPCHESIEAYIAAGGGSPKLRKRKPWKKTSKKALHPPKKKPEKLTGWAAAFADKPRGRR